METFAPFHPAINLSPQLYYQLVYTLTDLLPPPLDESPEALRARNHAAIAKVAAMRPVNANEADLAAQCIVARAQAEDIMRLIRENRDDIKLVARLNAQYTSMARMSLATHKHLIRVQALRQKREAIEALARQDARTRHIVERSMLRVADPDFERLTAASPPAARTPRVDQTIEKNVSQNNTNSHGVAFETAMSDPLGNQGRGRSDDTAASPKAAPVAHLDPATAENASYHEIDSRDVAFETWRREPSESQGPDETGLRKRVLDAMAAARLAGT